MIQAKMPMVRAFKWNGHDVQWELSDDLHAQVRSLTTTIPDYIDTAVRFMVMFNIKRIVIDDATTEHIIQRQS